MQPIPFSYKDLRFQEAKRVDIRVKTWASTAVTLDVLGFTKEGPFKFNHTTTADRVVSQSDFSLETGMIKEVGHHSMVGWRQNTLRPEEPRR